MKNVMKKAHEITKKVIRKSDSYRATFRLALSLAHSLIKKGVDKMIGTEKQVAWATDIKNEMVKATEIIDAIEETLSKFPNVDSRFIEVLDKMKQVRENIKNEENAKWFIDNRKSVAHFSNGIKTNLVELGFAELFKFEEIEIKAMNRMIEASKKLYIERF